MKLTKKQRGFAEMQRDKHRDDLDGYLAELVEARRKWPKGGQVAERLAWVGEALMVSDHLYCWWQDVLDQADDPDNQQTPEGLRDYYLDKLRRKDPPSSGGAESHRLNSRAEHAALLDFLNDLDGQRFRCGGKGLLGMTDDDKETT